MSIMGLLMMLAFSNQWVFRLGAGLMETKIQPYTSITDTVDIAVIAGGTASWHKPSHRVRFNQSADRLWQGIALLQQNRVKRLVFTGGSGDIKQEKRKEAHYIAEYLHLLGISDSLLIYEDQSKNTHENALFTAKLFEKHGYNKKIILITSAFHMKRARGCFEKQGFEVVPYACDPMTDGDPLKIHEYLLPSVQALMNWEVLLKEWVGILMYKTKDFM